MKYHYYTADVFTDRIFGGNQLAVLPDATGLTTEVMHAITREFNYSETAFVLPPENDANARRLRIFTPGAELPFAGHPTIGTAHVLGSIGAIELRGDPTTIVFEEGVGPVRVEINHGGGSIGMIHLTPALLPEVGPEPPPVEILARVLGLDPGDILQDAWRPRIASAGVPFLVIPLRSREALGRIIVDRQTWLEHIAPIDANMLYPISFDPERLDSDLRVRMFAPGLGIGEDPATGSAASALAGYLAANETTNGTFTWTVEQGFEMGRPSILRVEATRKGGRLVGARVGGTAVMVCEGTIEAS